MSDTDVAPEGLETKNLPGGYASANVPAADTLGYYNQGDDTINYPDTDQPADDQSTGDVGSTDADPPEGADAGNDAGSTEAPGEPEQQGQDAPVVAPDADSPTE